MSIEDASRKEAEQAYTITAFDYVRNPVGSFEWTIFWKGWQAARQSSQSEPVVPTADYVAYLYRDGNRLKVLETWPPDNDAFPVFTTNIQFLDVARLVLDDSVDLILEHGGVKLWEALVTKVNKDYAERNHEQ
jgi:hypothetical protein